MEARDGRVSLTFDDVPVPLTEEDHLALNGGAPDYDMVGRGIYLALRNNPDCAFGPVYAGWLRDAYPHHLAELANMIVMLDRKDVDVPYLDRKVNYLKIMTLLEPDNHLLPAEIGAVLLDRGLRMSALHQSTVMLYRAEAFLKRAHEMSPADDTVKARLGEVHYLLGHYGEAAGLWDELLQGSKDDKTAHLASSLDMIRAGRLPRIPPVDYLEAIGVAFGYYQTGEFEECAAILNDVLDDLAFCERFPLPEVWYYLGQCYQNLAMPRNAEDCFSEALKKNPDYSEAHEALAGMSR